MLALACAAAPPCVYSSNAGHVRASGSGDSSHDTARGGMAAPLPAGNCTGVRFVMVTKHRIAGTLLTNFGHKVGFASFAPNYFPASPLPSRSSYPRSYPSAPLLSQFFCVANE